MEDQIQSQFEESVLASYRARYFRRVYEFMAMYSGPLETFEVSLSKNVQLNLRVPVLLKADIKAKAKELGMTAGAYVAMLHRVGAAGHDDQRKKKEDT